MQCPKCEAVMEQLRYGPEDRVVNRCTQCKGLFMKPVNLRRLKDTVRADIIDKGDVDLGREFNKVDDINCPECGKKMDKVSDEKQTHIWYESCPDGHGVFLDAGELSDFNHETLLDTVRDWIVGKRH